MTLQPTLPTIDDFFLSERLAESRALVRKVASLSGDTPLIIQFSGGKDSMAMLGLVQEVTSNFVCAFMATGLELPGVVKFVKDTCRSLGAPLIISHPGMYKGNLFKRVEKFKSWPGLIATWCCRDLKLRPEKALLAKTFGRKTFYKLEGIRVAESVRRRYIYKDVAEDMMRRDGEHKSSFEVFPLLKWADADVENYLAMKQLPTTKLYAEVGVSGCALCPFYQPEIFYRVMQRFPDLWIYKKAIEWEEKLGQPFGNGYVYLRDIKQAVLDGAPCPQSQVDRKHRPPCMVEIEPGVFKNTCDVFGHTYIPTKTGEECFRCGHQMLTVSRP